ncbi:MAG: hypothetical protein OXD30_09810, partial [Bryobacterales bacterium]|nr:hypothetical protein [Bryobacterales bacterium]
MSAARGQSGRLALEPRCQHGRHAQLGRDVRLVQGERFLEQLRGLLLLVRLNVQIPPAHPQVGIFRRMLDRQAELGIGGREIPEHPMGLRPGRRIVQPQQPAVAGGGVNRIASVVQCVAGGQRFVARSALVAALARRGRCGRQRQDGRNE